MKKMIFGLALIATCVASATTVTSANTFGVLKVTSSDEETIISVPWLKVGATEEAEGITADKLVLTSTLKQGDELYAFNGSTYYKWTLSSAGVWTKDTTTIKSGLTNGSQDPDQVTLLRGVGLILVRSTKKDNDNTSTSEIKWASDELGTTPIYLYGQHAELTTATSTATRTTTGLQTTLIAPPTTADVKLSSVGFTGAVEGDQIIVDSNTIYTYWNTGSENEWCRKETTASGARRYVSDKDVKIPAGRGAWYVCKTGESAGSVTINWPVSSVE